MIPAILNLNRASCCASLRGSTALNMNSVLQRGDESCGWPCFPEACMENGRAVHVSGQQAASQRSTPSH